MARAVDDPVWAGDDDDDARIVQLAHSPGADALELLYRRYADQVWRLCRSRLGSDTDADDACQEALLRAHSALPRFRTGAPMWPWLATIAGNVCIDMQRKRRCDSLDAGDVDEGDLRAHGSSTDPHTAVVGRLRHELVDHALHTLPTRYRSAIHLRDLEGWSYADIAELNGSTVATVRGTLHRGRQVLREQVRTLATGRGLWPLPALVPSLFRLPSWVRRTAAVRPNGVNAASQLGTGLGPAGAQLAAAAAVIVTMAGAVALPNFGDGTSTGAAPLSTGGGLAAAATEPLLEEDVTDAASATDGPADADGGRTETPTDDEVLPPMAPAPPAGASADVGDGDGVVRVSGTADVDDGSEEQDDEDDVESDSSIHVGCDKTSVQRTACDEAERLQPPIGTERRSATGV